MRSQLKSNTIVVTRNGCKLKVESFISAGGQGEVYRVLNEGDNLYYALKLYHRSKISPVAMERIKGLVELKLDRLNAGICAPFDTISCGGLIGHVAPFAGGDTLLQSLEDGQLSYPQVFKTALDIVTMMDALQRAGVIHGDIQTQNFKVEMTKAGVIIKAIDLDNYSIPSSPRPNMVGMTLYMAPELRERYLADRRVYPTELSDRYALGVLLHEVLLHFHPIAGLDGTVDEINAAMLSGGWAYDPGLVGKLVNPHGYPVKSLNEELIGLLRRALSSDPSSRPKPSEWVDPLKRASTNITACSLCGVPFVIRQRQSVCPFGHRASRLALYLKDKEEIPCDNSITVLGRRELGGGKSISRRHILIRKLGGELFVESIGLNSTSIRSDGVWRKLVPNEIRKLKPDDRILVAGEELNYSQI
jgi:serine/threonine protein kinase